MKFRRLLVPAAVIAGSLAIFAGTASAATLRHPQYQQGSYSRHDDRIPACIPVLTPQEPNYSWVQNTTGETVTVTLDGNYYWVQTRTGNGPVTYLGPKTMTVTLAPGEEISVAWRSASGEHSWCWTGCCTTVAAVPCPVVTTPPCNPRTIVYTPPKQPCRHQDPCTGGRHLTGGPVRSII
jgi:hypothetical protein